MNDKYAALKEAAAYSILEEGQIWWDEQQLSYDDGVVFHKADMQFISLASPETIVELLAEREADKARIAELSESHSKLRDTIAAIHNTIRMDGGYTPLAAIINAARRAHEESAVVAAGITLETGV
ncbi:MULTISPECIES: hypothetical protein [Pseudescherichia]|uniref:hypothetical protein n=1 Tax=Pseudescherichia TaxID=2055880 RepID=UPI00301C5033